MVAVGDHNPRATTKAPITSSPPAVSSSPGLHLSNSAAVDAAASAGQAQGDTTPALDTGECESLALGTDTSADEETSTHRPLEWEVIGTFRYHDDGRLAEEWVQTDYRSFQAKFGVTTTESARRTRP